MIRTLILSAVAAAASPALAQHEHHADPAPGVEAHAGHQVEDEATSTQSADDPHAGHQVQDEGSSTQPAEDPHAGHGDTASPVGAETDPHAGHSPGSTSSPPVAPPPPEASSGPAHAADLVYGADVMAQVREELDGEHGSMNVHKFLIDRLEARIHDGSDGFAWSGQFWYGGDIDKLWLKSDGEGTFGKGADAEVQALWSHAIDPWFDVQLGVRQDVAEGPDRTHLVASVQGIAPYWFEVDGSVFLSSKGDLTARVEGEYDLRLTQKLYLQPRIEIDLAAQDVPELGIGSGLSTADVGARLRYEILPELAPYIGVEYERAFGDTRDFRRAEGEDASGWSFLVGVRTWF